MGNIGLVVVGVEGEAVVVLAVVVVVLTVVVGPVRRIVIRVYFIMFIDYMNNIVRFILEHALGPVLSIHIRLTGSKISPGSHC